ncbi:hypothetical protein CC86DRAFT_167554 [Ophiobolus disseminans]|uniref:Uncharacterized protein n=1 Tax=Ophiobolus disseminans TaxID=1469910 RepID=A0A6A7ACD2_9PLEO|nr:hypothetical protein CC86DRAFT_167554 [Ophiobolus disseminans]
MRQPRTSASSGKNTINKCGVFSRTRRDGINPHHRQHPSLPPPNMALAQQQHVQPSPPRYRLSHTSVNTGIKHPNLRSCFPRLALTYTALLPSRYSTSVPPHHHNANLSTRPHTSPQKSHASEV